MKEGFVRKSVALVLATGFIAVLAGCSAVPQLATCLPPHASGDSSNSVTAQGAFLAKPTVGFPTPIVSPTEQTSTLITGEGEVLQKGMVADIQATLYLGATGTAVGDTGYDQSTPFRVNVGGSKDAIGDTLQCLTVGSRVATVMTAKQFYAAAPTNQPSSLKDSDTLVLVTDIQRAFLGRANGVEVPAQAGLPSVVTAADGTPGVSLPHQAAPNDLRIGVVRQGDGDTVKEGDSVAIHATGIVWETQAVFQSTWPTHMPVDVTATASTDGTAGGIPPGFAKALIGQKVGSQVIVVVPPKFGYASGKNPSGVPAGSTMVFVFDILGIL